jgi:hypothetical protein
MSDLSLGFNQQKISERREALQPVAESRRTDRASNAKQQVSDTRYAIIVTGIAGVLGGSDATLL